MQSSLRRIGAANMVDLPSIPTQPPRGNALAVAHSLSVVSSTVACQPTMDGQAVREGLGALRAGQEEIGQFVSSLFEELDAAWHDMEEDHTRMNTERQKLVDAQTDFSARRAQWEMDHRQRTDAMQRRVVELEKDRLVLRAELEAARSQATELHQTLTELQRQLAAERTEWNLELRLLRDVLDRQAGATFGSFSTRADSAAPNKPANQPASNKATPDGFDYSGQDNATASLPQFLPAHLTPGPLPRAIPRSKDAVQRPAKPSGPLAAGTSDPILGPLLSRFAKLRGSDNLPQGGGDQGST